MQGRCPMSHRKETSLTPEEARKLHYEALVIDAQQPPATSGFLFTERMRAALNEYIKRDGTKARDEISPLMEEMAVQEIKTSQEARDQYLDLWRRSGVTVASGTYAGTEPPSKSFELATKRLAQAHAVVDALDGELILYAVRRISIRRTDPRSTDSSLTSRMPRRSATTWTASSTSTTWACAWSS